MSDIYLHDTEQAALKAIETGELSLLIDRCMTSERVQDVRHLAYDHGDHVAAKYREFRADLEEYAKAKAAQKRDSTRSTAERAGSRLLDAVRLAQARAIREEAEVQLYRVDEHILPPIRFSDDLTVSVHFRWRTALDDAWTYGSITFSHHTEERRIYGVPGPKRRPRAPARERERQEWLLQTWEHLKRQALWSVLEFFRDGGTPAQIPREFQATTGPQGGLNNFSAKFWKEQS